MAGVFSGKAETADTLREGEVEKLHAKIGQLVVERIFIRKPPVDEPGSEARHDRHQAPRGFSIQRQCQLVSIKPLGLLLPAEGPRRR